jgi:hypothetical protein
MFLAPGLMTYDILIFWLMSTTLGLMTYDINHYSSRSIFANHQQSSSILPVHFVRIPLSSRDSMSSVIPALEYFGISQYVDSTAITITAVHDF